MQRLNSINYNQPISIFPIALAVKVPINKKPPSNRCFSHNTPLFAAMDKTGFLCKHTSHNAYHRMDYITVSETELFAIVYTTSDNILPTHTSLFSNQHTCTLWDKYTASFTSLRNIDLTGSWSKCWFTLMCKSLVHSNFFSVCLSVRLSLSLSFWTVDKKSS